MPLLEALSKIGFIIPFKPMDLMDLELIPLLKYLRISGESMLKVQEYSKLEKFSMVILAMSVGIREMHWMLL